LDPSFFSLYTSRHPLILRLAFQRIPQTPQRRLAGWLSANSVR
jgi:hypothetical protein